MKKTIDIYQKILILIACASIIIIFGIFFNSNNIANSDNCKHTNIVVPDITEKIDPTTCLLYTSYFSRQLCPSIWILRKLHEKSTLRRNTESIKIKSKSSITEYVFCVRFGGEANENGRTYHLSLIHISANDVCLQRRRIL